MKTYLHVPYAEKDEAKQFGARWDAAKKKWYAEDIENMSVFDKWKKAPTKPPEDEEVIQVNPDDFDIVIYTDGASKGNPGRGGWGIFMTQGDKVTEEFGGQDNVTNNQMELTATIKALELADKSLKLLIKTDSKYVIDGATKWINGWRKNGWKGSNGELKNKELWQELDSLKSQYAIVVFEWVKGHSGEVGNERADALANLGCEK